MANKYPLILDGSQIRELPDSSGISIGSSSTITDTKVGQWETAYGWGDHASGGYAQADSVNTSALVGTLDSARFPSVLPAIDGSLLSGLGGGFYESYAMIVNEQPSGTNGGGTSTSATWHTRVLNTELYDADGIVSISSNQFTLGAGTYTISARCPSYRTNVHLAALYSVTDTSYVRYGIPEHSGSGYNTQTQTYVIHTFTISSSKTYEIRHYTQDGYGTYGLGVGLSPSPATTILTTVEIWKHA